MLLHSLPFLQNKCLKCLCSAATPQLKVSVFVHNGREDEVEGSCINVLTPLTLVKAIFKSSLKSFRLKHLFQRSVQRQHKTACESALGNDHKFNCS